MTMTPGERAIWAAAYVEALRTRYERLDPTGAPLGGPPTRSGILRAAMDAAAAVQMARDALPKLVSAEAKPQHAERHRRAIEMLSDMLGVDAAGNPYR